MASLNIKPKSTIQYRKWAKITDIWFWVHLLAEHGPKSDKYRFAKFGQLTEENLGKVQNLFWSYFLFDGHF